MVTRSEERDLQQIALDYCEIHPREWQAQGEPGKFEIWAEVVDHCRFKDSAGKIYIDAFAGRMFTNVGYGWKEIADAAYEQMLKATSIPASPGALHEPQILLAEKLAQITPGSLKRTTFASGGSEGVEVAVKIAKAYHKLNGQPTRYKLISKRGTYHGFTHLGMALMRSAGTQIYEPLEYGVRRVSNVKCYRCDFNLKYPECGIECARELERVIVNEGPETVAAIVFDAVSHSQIGTPPKPEYWPMIKSICDKYGVLIIDDEVVCGFGRTGKWFGLENWDVVPDIMVMAKGISSGYLPLGAVIAKEEICEKFTAGFAHIITFGGLPGPCAAGLKNIEIMERENLVENSAVVGAYLLEQLNALMGRHVCIGDVRGIGLLTQTEMVANRETKESLPADIVNEFKTKLQANGLVTRVLPAGIISLFPPIVFSRANVDEAIGMIDKTMTEMEKDGKFPS